MLFFQKGQASGVFCSFFSGIIDFILNSKFMILDKKSTGYNAMFSIEDSCQQWGLSKRGPSLEVEPYRLGFKVLFFAWTRT